MILAVFLARLGRTVKSYYLAAVRNLYIQAGVSFPGQDEELPWLQSMLHSTRWVASQHQATLSFRKVIWYRQTIWTAVNLYSSGFLCINGVLCKV